MRKKPLYHPMTRRFLILLSPLLLIVLLMHQAEKGVSNSPTLTESPGSFILTTQPSHRRREGKRSEPSESLLPLRSGKPLTLQIDGEPPYEILSRPLDLFADNFQISLGSSQRPSFAAPTAFSLRAWGTGKQAAPLHGCAVVLGEALAMELELANGGRLRVRTHPETGALESVRQAALATECTLDPDGDRYAIRNVNPLSKTTNPWQSAKPAEIRALTGVDPATGTYDKYVTPISRGLLYDRSLKEALLLLVADQSATGPNNPSNLASKASTYLATVATVAGVYENQLGIKLLLQELILTPSGPEYPNVPSTDTVAGFSEWLASNRPQARYGWTMASKFGAGLPSGTLGLAYLRTLSDPDAVSVLQPETAWDVLAHEMGHNLGSDHSQGGLMNSTDTQGLTRTFFTDVTVGETSAKDIYDYSKNLLVGPSPMRHPEEIPFANEDARVTGRTSPVRFNPLSNDDTKVRNGKTNTLSLEEISQPVPAEAGTVAVDGHELVFTPSGDYQGRVWFSYTLRGNVGNADRGWLHKGDVAITIGQAPAETKLTLAPGGSTSVFAIDGTFGLTQPAHGRVDVSRDDPDLLILRADADARGTDSFHAGNAVYSITYSNATVVARRDRVFYDPQLEAEIAFNPLTNDTGAGYPWESTPGITLLNAANQSHHYFPTTLRLVSARNLTESRGDLVTSTRSFTIDGKPLAVLSSTLTFVPDGTQSGPAFIEYVVEDAVGNRATGIVELNDGSTSGPGLRFASPEAQAVALPAPGALLLEAEPSGFPFEPSYAWALLSGPAAGIKLDSPNHAESVVRLSQNGIYILRLTATLGTDTATTTLTIAVGGTPPAGAVTAPTVDAGNDFTLTKPTASLAGTTSGQIESVHWSVFPESAAVVFSNPNQRESVVAFSAPGSYRLRFEAISNEVTVLDELTCTVPAAALTTHGVITLAPTALTSGSAQLQGRVVSSSSSSIDVVFYLGIEDFGENAAAWPKALPLGARAPGPVSVLASGLTYGFPYLYRIKATQDGRSVWSEVGHFETLPPDATLKSLIVEGEQARILLPQNGDLDRRWFLPEFDDHSWLQGPTGIGFELGTGFESAFRTDISSLYGHGSSAYVRIPFTVSELAGMETLTLRVKYDDAFAAYLNGREIARSATAGTSELAWDSAAPRHHPDDDALIYEDFDITIHRNQLVYGQNVLAIHVLNRDVLNKNLLLVPVLQALSRPNYYEDWLGEYSSAVPIAERGLLNDPDTDGLDNLQEYAFGADPAKTDDRTRLLPRLALSADGQHLDLVYQRRTDALTRGLSFIVEYSLDLSEWQVLSSPSERRLAFRGAIEDIAIPLSLTNAPMYFWRLRVGAAN